MKEERFYFYFIITTWEFEFEKVFKIPFLSYTLIKWDGLDNVTEAKALVVA